MNKIEKIYFLHPENLYNTPQEERDLNLIKYLWPDASIYNPNSKKDEQKYKEYGIEWFLDRIADCQLIIFRRFIDGKIGVTDLIKIKYGTVDCAIPILELPIILESQQLSINDTMEYLNLC